ncbi:MAG: K(+)-transporting ATPase subunit F [Leptothrix sp. (in: b-proteobacteria)]
MDIVFIELAAALAAGLFVYLVAVLLRPEDFS